MSMLAAGKSKSCTILWAMLRLKVEMKKERARKRLATPPTPVLLISKMYF